MTTPKTDRKLLELAAKAAGFDISHKWNRASMDMEHPVVAMVVRDAAESLVITGWNPLDNSGDALDLAVKLKIRIGFRPCAYADTPSGLRFFGAHDCDDQFSRTRLAIVRAAAAIGRAMP